MSTLIDRPTRILFFTGKGGVGKTSAACATAVGLADVGRRVLLVSTDPASNLDEVLGVKLSAKPTHVPHVPGLSALNIDPVQAARDYRERVVGPYRGILPAVAIHSMEEQLSGACTVEIAAFDAFSTLLGDSAATIEFDHVIFDTAPTGHTLRLLELPAAWSDFIDTNVGGTSCLGPLSGLQGQKVLYAASNQTLRDPAQTTVVLVARPDRSSLLEAERTRAELAHIGVRNLRLILNGVFHAQDATDVTAVAMDSCGRAALATLPAGISALDRVDVPLLGGGLVGIAALRQMGAASGGPSQTFSHEVAATSATSAMVATELREFDDMVDSLAKHSSGVVMTMGKGGVGKTTIAARIAIALAQRGYPVTLTTTDPAAHIQAAMDAQNDESDTQVAGLVVTRIDPALEVARYTAEVMATVGSGLDAQGKALLQEDLRSPCTEEIAVFRAFAETVAQGADRFVIIDTAPTGHTLLLLDAAESYHREVLKRPSGSPEAVKQLLPRLRDPAYTHVILVTLPEATPIHEAMQLERDLARADIKPFVWVVNQSLTPLHVTDPILVARKAQEVTHLAELAAHTPHIVLESWRVGFLQ